ncbi:metallophosphoesterase family protein [Halomicroarcula sp. GCM10025709]|uniref:metallophosphoesterase family protein n=1 Tax=Halomicroarcula sp. GCM10025709 TaxID=3252669 RepID=UPI003611626C
MRRTIGLLYDPHIVAGGRDGYDGVPTVEAAIDRLNEVPVDWTVVGGDLRHLLGAANEHNDGRTDWGGWHGDPDNYFYRRDFGRAKRLFDERLDGDYVVARGNNDRPLDVYREYFPAEAFPQWGWFVEDGARYVVLDTNPHPGHHALRDQQNFVSAPQISMLERLMDTDPEIPTFVFLHAPVAKHQGIDDWETGHTAAYKLTLNYPTVQRVLARGTRCSSTAVTTGRTTAVASRSSTASATSSRATSSTTATRTTAVTCGGCESTPTGTSRRSTTTTWGRERTADSPERSGKHRILIPIDPCPTRTTSTRPTTYRP